MPIYIFLGTGDAASMNFGSIGSVNGLVHEDNVLFREDPIGRFNVASEERYSPVIKRVFPANEFFNVIAHARSLTKEC
jgi:hypothetical protein